MLPSEPPHDDKKPEDEDEEDDVPQPATPLTLRHIVHAPERASENARRFRKRVVLLHQHEKRVLSVSQKSLRAGCGDIGWMCERTTTSRAILHTYPEIKKKETTHHLTELDGRIAYFVPNPDRNLRRKIPKQKKCVYQLPISSEEDKRKPWLCNGEHEVRVCVLWGEGEGGGRWKWCRWTLKQRGGIKRTSLSNFTLALSPSMASSFWPSRSSAKRAPETAAASDEALWRPGYGDERPEWGGVGTNEGSVSSPRAARDTRCLRWGNGKRFVFGVLR